MLPYIPDIAILLIVYKVYEKNLNSVHSDSLYISVITIGELKKGLIKLKVSEKQKKLIKWFNILLKKYTERILPVDLKIAEEWGIIQGNAEKKGKPMPSIDCLLAATAAVHKLTLVTRNESDFEVSNVPVINPWKLL